MLICVCQYMKEHDVCISGNRFGRLESVELASEACRAYVKFIDHKVSIQYIDSSRNNRTPPEAEIT